jgi:UTP--glucose-1-phosphate uridylyltransferase
MIVSAGKRAIEEHFDRNWELEATLAAKGRKEELEQIRKISNLANIHYIWQKELNGLGDAVSYARNHVGNEPFLLLLGDTLIQSKKSVTRELIDVYDRYNESVVALEEVPRELVGRYGVIGGKPIDNGLYLINDLVEKPDPETAPSNLVIAARYVFSPKIFDYIEKTPRGKGGEVQLTDAMKLMLRDSAMYGLLLDGHRHDIGNKLDFLKTNVIYGIDREDFGAEFREFIKEIAKTL